MNPRVTKVKPLPDFMLELWFTNEEHRIFDVKPYLSIGIFQELQDKNLFVQAKPFNGTVVWPNELDFDPDRLYLDSQQVVYNTH